MFDKKEIKDLLEFTLKTVEKVEADEPESEFLDYGLCSVWHDLERDGILDEEEMELLIDYLDSKIPEITHNLELGAETDFVWPRGEWEERKHWLRKEIKELSEQSVKKIYVAMIATGRYDDYYETPVFASEDESKVNNWVERFNKIIKDNRERIVSYKDNLDEQPFWFDCVMWESPRALMAGIPIRE